mmetsp:Transcript_27661/g.38459  ORF Transcript_27661/g.38459 Transcript_27661/m.38459 type:complete len:124 (+) Transcript_27661:73-444(+)
MDEPKAFVNWQAVQKILEKENTAGITSTLLFNFKGSLLTSAGDVKNEHIISALMANIWKSYAESQKNLNFMLVDCEEGHLGIAGIGRFLICMYTSDFKFPLGLLKAKIEKVVAKLDKPLSSVF